eukprot:12925426-Prorocentrum_lima.AAC.1
MNVGGMGDAERTTPEEAMYTYGSPREEREQANHDHCARDNGVLEACGQAPNGRVKWQHVDELLFWPLTHHS